jgi:hypothetical protein
MALRYSTTVTPIRCRSYRQSVVLAIAVGGVLVFIVAGLLVWTARLVHVGNLDAHALAEKVAVPRPVSALDWPELHLRCVVAQPDEPPLVLLLVDWPRHPEQEATLLVALDRGDDRSLTLLSQWCAGAASLSPTRRYNGEYGELELRRRQSLERVHAVLITEDGPGE